LLDGFGKRTNKVLHTVDRHKKPSSWFDVFKIFLKLGLTSFGGPIAHLGFFRHEIVERRKWMDEHAYADLVALCQFLPGPASSQVGIAIGLSRAGYAGAFAAWLGFTLPSAIALVLFAFGMTALGGAYDTGWLHGLKIAAFAVVAQAVWTMGRKLTPDRERLTLAIAATALVLAVPAALGANSRNCVGRLVRHYAVEKLHTVSACGISTSGEPQYCCCLPCIICRAFGRVAAAYHACTK
jgi:chromate transport protein ChrA